MTAARSPVDARRPRKPDEVLVMQEWLADCAMHGTPGAFRRVGERHGRSDEWCRRIVRSYQARKQPAPFEPRIMSRTHANAERQRHRDELLQTHLILWSPADSHNAAGLSAAVFVWQCALAVVLTSALVLMLKAPAFGVAPLALCAVAWRVGRG